MNIICNALYHNMSFTTAKGSLTIQDLFQLPCESDYDNVLTLDSLYRNLSSKIDKNKGLSKKKTNNNQSIIEGKMEVIKTIFEYKKTKEKEEKELAETRQHNARILDLIEKRKDKDDSKLSVKELTSLLK